MVAEFERVRNAADCTQASDVRSLESAERRAVADRAEERELEERHVSACARLGDAREALHACQERESASAASTSGQERERYEMDARASEAAREERECLEAQTKAESQLARCLEELRECRESLPGGRHSLKERENASRVATLQRLFGAGVRGRLVDCCKPAQRKYATAVCFGVFFFVLSRRYLYSIRTVACLGFGEVSNATRARVPFCVFFSFLSFRTPSSKSTLFVPRPSLSSFHFNSSKSRA